MLNGSLQGILLKYIMLNGFEIVDIERILPLLENIKPRNIVLEQVFIIFLPEHRESLEFSIPEKYGSQVHQYSQC